MREVLEEICARRRPQEWRGLRITRDEMLAEAREPASIAPNLVVKVPPIADGIRLVKTLSEEGVQTNVTLQRVAGGHRRRPGPTSAPSWGDSMTWVTTAWALVPDRGWELRA